MSNLLATLTIAGRDVVSVDHGCPTWFYADEMTGLNVVPTWEHKLADALAIFAGPNIGMDLIFDSSVERVVDLTSPHIQETADVWREKVYATDRVLAELVIHSSDVSAFQTELTKLREVIVLGKRPILIKGSWAKVFNN